MEKPVALITGASSGIGQAIAFKLARQDYITVLAARDQDALQKTSQQIEADGGPCPLIIPTDLRKSQDIKNLVDVTYQQLKRIDVLINNAGVLYLKPFLELKIAEFQEMLDINIKAVFELTQQVVPFMIAQKQGTIVNIASIAGKRGFKTGSGYAATKFALRGFADALIPELRVHQLRMITVFPGSVDTPMLDGHPGAPKKETMLKGEDIANAVYAAISADPRAMISEIDIRPTNPLKA